ncbi:hypothetical protein PybrP1_006704 [[Pythium] brassicae (nom. inval.)]|nr:hypothetical protein PybrP1_006704 [[Pythium] brassicae (nom. inval.)]
MTTTVNDAGVSAAVAPPTTSSAPHVKFALRSDFSFLKVAILTEDGSEAVTDAKRLKFTLDNTLKAVFGVMGASMSEFDILALQRQSRVEPTTALLRGLWGAITMCTSIDGKLCKLEVVHVGASLMEMASGRFLDC